MLKCLELLRMQRNYMCERLKTDVCGVMFDTLTADKARERLYSALDGNASQTALFTPNPEIVMIAEKDSA